MDIWGDISRSVNGENVLGGVAYKNKYIYLYHSIVCGCTANREGIEGEEEEEREGRG